MPYRLANKLQAPKATASFVGLLGDVMLLCLTAMADLLQQLHPRRVSQSLIQEVEVRAVTEVLGFAPIYVVDAPELRGDFADLQ